MTDDPTDSQVDTEQRVNPSDRALDLIGTDKLWSGQLLYSSVQLGIIDLLSEDPIPADEVANELELNADNTYRLLRALSHFGVLHEDSERRFWLTSVGKRFQSDHPDSVRHHLLVDRSPEWVLPMVHLSDIVEEGGPNGFVREFGATFFDYLDDNPTFAKVFNDHMTGRSQHETELILEALDGYDFSDISSVCDVGGGHGHLLSRLLETRPHLEGTVLELPSVVAEEDRLWAPKLGVADRCTYEAGDMFEEVPRADAYFMKFILHDWEDEDCLRILSNVRDAAANDARLFVIESVVAGPNKSHFAKRLDMTMMVHVGGRERTMSEYSALFKESGWTHEERWDLTDAPLCILEARPI